MLEKYSNSKDTIEFDKIHNNQAFMYDSSEINRCIMCEDPLCEKACPANIPIGGIIRSYFFENYIGAMKKLIESISFIIVCCCKLL